MFQIGPIRGATWQLPAGIRIDEIFLLSGIKPMVPLLSSTLHTKRFHLVSSFLPRFRIFSLKCLQIVKNCYKTCVLVIWKQEMLVHSLASFSLVKLLLFGRTKQNNKRCAALTCREEPCRCPGWNTCENAAQGPATFACIWRSHQAPELCRSRSGARAARCPCRPETCRQLLDCHWALDLEARSSCIRLGICGQAPPLLRTVADRPSSLPSF